MTATEDYADAGELDHDSDHLGWLQNRTTVIEMDNGGIIVGEF